MPRVVRQQLNHLAVNCRAVPARGAAVLPSPARIACKQWQQVPPAFLPACLFSCLPTLVPCSTNSTTETYQLKVRLGDGLLPTHVKPAAAGVPACDARSSYHHRGRNETLHYVDGLPHLCLRLQCNLNFKITSNNTIDCELDQGPLHSAIKFSCDARVSAGAALVGVWLSP